MICISPKKNTLFLKILLVFLFVLFPLFVTQQLMYRWGRDIIENEISDSSKSNLSYLQNNISDLSSDILMQLNILLSSNQLLSFNILQNTYSDAQYYEALTNIKNLLNLVKNSNPYIKDIELYYVTRTVALSAGTGLIPMDKLPKLLETSCLYGNTITAAGNELWIGYSKPSVLKESTIPVYYIRAILDEVHLRKVLDSFTNPNTCLLLHNTGELISGKNMSDNLMAHSSALKSIQPLAQSDEAEMFSLTIGDKNYTVFQTYLQKENLSLFQLVNTDSLLEIPDKFRKFTLIFSCLAFISIAIFTLAMYYYINRPIHDLMYAFNKAGNGDLGTKVNLTYAIEYKQLSSDFNSMVEKLSHLITTNYEQTILLQQAELKQLQSQINPHFLYNSFFLMRHMLNEEQLDTVKLFLQQIGEYYQYITRDHSDVVTLSQEYRHCSNYLSIQLLRFEDRLTARTLSLPAEYQELMVPRLILQPIVENAIEHGIESNFDTGMIRISFSDIDADYLEMKIEDNGNTNIEEKLANVKHLLAENINIGQTTGIRNINERLKIYYADQHCGLYASKSELGGLCISVIIKKEKREDNTDAI